MFFAIGLKMENNLKKGTLLEGISKSFSQNFAQTNLIVISILT